MKKGFLFSLAVLILLSMACSSALYAPEQVTEEIEVPVVNETGIEPSASAVPCPEPTEEPKKETKLYINPDIGKHDVIITVTVENPNPEDSYEIKRISEKPLVETEGRVSEQVIKEFWTYYALLPEPLRDSFEQSDFRILITKKNLNETYYDKEVDGFINGIFSPTRKTIFLYGSTRSLNAGMLHEFGHYLDWVNGFPSQTEELCTIFEEENAALDNVMIHNSTEMFAEVFQSILLGKEDITPKATAFVRRFLAE